MLLMLFDYFDYSYMIFSNSVSIDFAAFHDKWFFKYINVWWIINMEAESTLQPGKGAAKIETQAETIHNESPHSAKPTTEVI